MDCGIIINVSTEEFAVQMGGFGRYVIPAKQPSEKFALLVVEPAREVIDEGFGKTHAKEWNGSEVARDVAGQNSDQNYSRFGVFVCEAKPELTREIEKLEDEERLLNKAHPRYVNANKELVDTHYDAKCKLAEKIQKARARFHAECRAMVTDADLRKANENYFKEAQRLIVDADQMWARGPGEQKNINDRHRRAANVLGQERPWAYMPSSLVDCPGCGGKKKESAIVCPHCGALIDEPLEAYAKMTTNERARKLYPERYAEPEPVGAKK